MKIKTNTIDKNLIDLIQETKLKEQILELSKAYNKVIDKPFSIGVMGKAGAGKSSFINSLCQSYVCETGGVGGCTREIQKIEAKLGEMDIYIYDFPGIAENTQWSKSYWDCYVSYLEILDKIFWMIKIDDRAMLEDEKFYNENIQSDYDISQKFIAILSQADKAEPSREWNHDKFEPSSAQIETMLANKFRIYQDFMDSSTNAPERIISISTDFIKEKNTFKTYGFDNIFNMFAITLNSIDTISNELPLSVSWEITKREVDISFEFTKYITKKAKEKLNSTLSTLKYLI